MLCEYCIVVGRYSCVHFWMRNELMWKYQQREKRADSILHNNNKSGRLTLSICVRSILSIDCIASIVIGLIIISPSRYFHRYR